MKPRLPPILAILLLPTAAPTQDGPDRHAIAARQSQFVLPAGQHGLGELLDLLGQIRKTPVRCEQDEIGRGNSPVMLQRELHLDGDAFDDVVTTLLFYRGEGAEREQRDRCHPHLPSRAAAVH